jgi:hypothetical protein
MSDEHNYLLTMTGGSRDDMKGVIAGVFDAGVTNSFALSYPSSDPEDITDSVMFVFTETGDTSNFLMFSTEEAYVDSMKSYLEVFEPIQKALTVKLKDTGIKWKLIAPKGSIMQTTFEATLATFEKSSTKTK